MLSDAVPDLAGVADFSAARRHHFVDQWGRRVLVGLTIEETHEFEILDSFRPLGESDAAVWISDGIPKNCLA